MKEDSDEVYALKERIRELEKMLGQEYKAPDVLRLTPGQNRILGVLKARPMVSMGSFVALLYGGLSRTPDNEENTVRARVSHLRAKLRRHGMDVTLDHGAGYHLGKAARVILAKLENDERV